MSDVLKRVVQLHGKHILISANLQIGLVETFFCEPDGKCDYSNELSSAKYPNSLLTEKGFEQKVKELEEIAETMKTKDGWREESIHDYLTPGDYIDWELYNYLLNIVPPKKNNYFTLVVGTPYDTVDGKSTYMTFTKQSGVWRYVGTKPLDTAIKSF